MNTNDLQIRDSIAKKNIGHSIDKTTLTAIQQLKSGTQFFFICEVIGKNDGIRRKKTATFVVQ